MVDSNYTCYGIVIKDTLRAVFLDKISALNQIMYYYRDQSAEIVILEGAKK